MGLPFKPVALSAVQRRKAEKAGVSIASMAEADKYYGGPLLNSLALEYLLCSNVFLLSRLYHLFGEEKNGKSTLAIDWLKRFFLDQGGDALLVETENKLNVPLFRRMLQDKYDLLQQARTTVLEAAQTAMTVFAKSVRDNTKKKNLVLGCIDVDSVRVLAESTVAQTEATGSAARNYAIEAGLWRTYLGSFMDMIQDMPIALIMVNHAREEAVEGTAIKKMGCGGGKAIKYYESYRILVKTDHREEKVKSSRSTLQLRTTTNTNGPPNRRIFPDIVYRGDADNPGMVYLDWNAADAELLCSDRLPKSELLKNDVCATKAASEKGLFNDEVLGLKRVPIQEITAAIYSDPDRLARFREINQIAVYKTLEELYEAGWFFNSAKVNKTDEDDEDAD